MTPPLLKLLTMLAPLMLAPLKPTLLLKLLMMLVSRTRAAPGLAAGFVAGGCLSSTSRAVDSCAGIAAGLSTPASTRNNHGSGRPAGPTSCDAASVLPG